MIYKLNINGSIPKGLEPWYLLHSSGIDASGFEIFISPINVFKSKA